MQFLPLLLKPSVIVGIIFALTLAWGGFEKMGKDRAEAQKQAVLASFDQFKAQVRAEGEAAQRAAKAREDANLKLTQEREAEHAKELKSLDAQYAAYRLRVKSGNSATGRIVPEASKAPGGGDTICYSRLRLDREITEAIGRFGSGLADDVEPYDKAALTARTCKDWVRSLQ